jgi:hypothetical protein
VRLARALDFAAVTDHAELLGEWNICNTPDLAGHGSIVCRVYRRWPRIAFFWMNYTVSSARRHGFCGANGAVCLEAARSPWQEIRRAARQAYERCAFTSFVGYEWTGAAGAGNNLHRNVIFANDVVPELPTSFVETPTPPQLWTRLRAECVDTGSGCDAVVIPHNSNLSAGLMFRTLREDGSPIDAAEARSRAELEVLVEVMQHKGDSECMTGLQTEDELCSFEKLAMNNFRGRYLRWRAEPPVAYQFIRNVLKEGLAQQARLGVNPFRYGRGLAVLWAEENSREALFAAMRRREAYGTSGPRMLVRFFGGWSYPADLCESSRLLETAYAGGVPMGGELPPRAGDAAADAAPLLAVSALRDPGAAGTPGTPLQRIQIVKGWTQDDVLHEHVWDVAGDPGNGASVDLDTCEPSGARFDSLCAVWRDPDFDPAQHAFYYARVVENPTCRWSQKLCVARGVRCDDPATIGEGLAPCCAADHVRTIQERAWTSPIWYRP